MKTQFLSILFAIMMVLSVFAFSACSLNGVEGPQGEQGEPGKDGKDGVGISSVVKISSKGLIDTYEITYTNGEKTTFTITNGANGADGVGICSAEVNDNGELVLYFTNNTSINLGKVIGSDGQNGEKGEDGVGIESIYIDENGNLVVTLTEGTVKNLGNIMGEDGKDLADCEHEFGKWIVDLEPTCDSIGVNYRVCAKCNEIEYDYIEKTNHEYVYLYTITNNCTQHKVMEECTVCGNVRTTNKEIQHDIVIDESVPPTCTTDGLTEGSHCSVCGEVFDAQEVIDMINHNYVGGVCTMCGDNIDIDTPDGYFIFTLLDNDTYSVKAKDANDMPSKIVIPSIYNGKAVTSIGTSAFYGCKSLTSVVIPDSVTSIGYQAFKNCSGLTNVVIGKSVDSIGSSAFSGCKILTSVVIPDSVTSIGYEAFKNCSSLKDVYYAGNEEDWAKISISSGNSYLADATIHYNYVPEE